MLWLIEGVALKYATSSDPSLTSQGNAKAEDDEDEEEDDDDAAVVRPCSP
jgi:hypothetical protein